MLKPEMPNTSGHRRSRSGTYFSGFTRLTAQFKARSTEKLNGLLQLDPHRRASSVRDLSRARDSPTLEAYKVRIEEELELEVQTLFRNKHKKYKEVTVPTSIKFSITRDSAQDSAVDMARPRSPSATGSKASDTDLLDQTLLNIRQKLNALSNDRVEMENKMQELMNGIQSVNTRCQNQQQQQQQSFPTPADIYSSIRRARSSATATMRPSNLNLTKDRSTADNDSQELDTPNLSQDSTLSASSQSSLSNLNLPLMRQRSASAAANLKRKPSKPSPISIQSAVSCSNIEEKPWVPATPIHELPESPTFVLSSSSPSLQCYSIHGTAPRGGYRRSCSVSSPSASTTETKRSPTMLISAPNISHPYETEYYHTLPNMSSHNKHSLSESVINSSIPEDEVDYASVTDSLSQLSTCTDEGSPKSGSTIITRRSSLTGQIEHYRKPRLFKKNSQPKELLTKKSSQGKELLVKKNSYPLELLAKTNLQVSDPNEAKRPSLSPVVTNPSPSGVGFKVLNKGRRSRRTAHRVSAVLPGIETTV